MRKLLLIIQELIIVNCILGMFAFLSITVQAKGRVLDEPMAKEITERRKQTMQANRWKSCTVRITW